MMTRWMKACFVLTAILTACSSDDAQPPSQAAGPEYLVSCDGAVTKASVRIDVGLAPRCIGGDGSTFGCSDDGCAAPEAAIRYELPAPRCPASNVYVWDGTSCRTHPTATEQGSMRCRGAGCEKLFKTEAECTAAYASCGR
ncbi:MAG: hypothetical protein KIT84_36065 [Labilithrix sp.]|nr:hypothetical protein [Labilithrix sp.]MCW5816470.1 hypothetical protein [Labilithrix sp.]